MTKKKQIERYMMDTVNRKGKIDNIKDNKLKQKLVIDVIAHNSRHAIRRVNEMDQKVQKAFLDKIQEIVNINQAKQENNERLNND